MGAHSLRAPNWDISVIAQTLKLDILQFRQSRYNLTKSVLLNQAKSHNQRLFDLVSKFLYGI